MKHAIKYINDGRTKEIEIEADNFKAAVERHKANLHGADLRRADLRGADIDFSAWPLHCGTHNVKADKKIAAQIAMHFCWLDCDDDEVKAAQDAVKPLAMQCRHFTEREL